MKKLLLIALAGFSLSGMSQAKKLCEGIFPKNHAWVGPEVTNQGIDQATFNAVLAKVTAVYAPIAQATGNTLSFANDWDDGTVNSDTYNDGNTWVIEAFGGLARYKGMTADGYTAVACHELGHHLGGAPLFSDGSGMSVEGEADYHVGTKCLRKVFAADDNIKAMANVKVDPAVVSGCTTSFQGNAQQIALCERAAVASFVVADILRDLEGDPALSYTTPDPSQVSQTNEDHPMAQCRLDTYFASTLCTVSSDVAFSQDDDRVGACIAGTGVRPRCWYMPDYN